MSTEELISPVFVVRCDVTGCKAWHRTQDSWDARSANGARREAQSYGWQTRPARGAGSRSALDLCPDHRDAGSCDCPEDVICELPAGHAGWHREGACEWTERAGGAR